MILLPFHPSPQPFSLSLANEHLKNNIKRKQKHTDQNRTKKQTEEKAKEKDKKHTHRDTRIGTHGNPFLKPQRLQGKVNEWIGGKFLQLGRL